MATYRAPSKDEAEKIRENGFDPASVVVDDRTGDVFGANDVPGPDYLTENLKSFVRAVPTVVTGPLRLGGAAADTVRQLTGEYQSSDPSALTQTADWLDRKAAEFAPQDPRANGLATIPGQVVGQIAGVLGGSKLASLLGSRGLSSMAGSAIGQSAAMTAGDTIQEEMDRQAREEITQDPARALAKGLVTGGGTALLEGGLGVGKFLRSLDEPAGTTMGNVLKRAGMSAASEAGQEAGQMAVVEEELLPEGIGTRALAGAIGGGVAGGAQGLALPTQQKPAAALSGKDMAAAKPAAPADQQQTLSLMDEPTREALLHMQRTGEEFDPVITTPQITMAKKLIEKGVPLDGDRLAELSAIADDIQLKQYANRLYTEHFRSAPVSEETTAKLVEKQQKEIGQIDQQLQKLNMQRTRLLAVQEKSAESGPGAEWMARNVEMIDAQIAQIDTAAERLLAQKAMLVEANPLQRPMSERVVAARFPGQRLVQPTVSEAESRVAGPAIPMPNRVFEQPAPPQPAGLLTEGEQGLPFGSGQSVSPGNLSGAKPVPETADQIAAQIQLTIDPASTKKATLITPGSPFDAENSPLPVVETPHGLVAFNPSKTTQEEVIAGTSGDVADGSLFGYGPGQTSDAAGAVAVDTTVEGTPGVLSQIVRTPEEATIAVAAQQAAAPEGETQVKPAERVIEERQSTILPGRTLLKRFTDEAQTLANRTYMLSGLSELNKDRPFGLTPNKEGEISVQSLRARLQSAVPKAEIAEYERNGLNDWLAGRNVVGVKELADWIQANGPRVEFLEIRPGDNGAEIELIQAEQDQLTQEHRLETLNISGYGFSGHGYNVVVFTDDATGDTYEYHQDNNRFFKIGSDFTLRQAELSEQKKQAVKNWATAAQNFDDIDEAAGKLAANDATIGKYGVEPRPVEELVNPVEGLVKAPAPANKDVALLADVFGGTDIGTAAGEQWTGGHHGESGHNALGFFRASEETLPDGRKGLHLFEVQSDWGSIDKVREGRNKGKYRTSDDKIHETFAAAEQHNATRHQLLPEYNRLVLKAAIKYAADRGLDFVAVSDAETAMMTEKHHQVAGMIRPIEPYQVGGNIWGSADRLARDGTSGFYRDIADEFGSDWEFGKFVLLNNDSVVRIDNPDANRRISNVNRARAVIEAGYGYLKPGDDPVAMPIPQEPGMRKNYDELLPNILQNLTGSAPEPVTFAGEHGNYSADAPAFNNKKTVSARMFDISLPKQAFAANEAYSLFGSDRLNPQAAQYRSALLPGESLWNDLKKSLSRQHSFNDETILTIGPAALYDFTQSSLGRMARDNPLRTYGAVVANKMFVHRNQIANEKLIELQKYKDFLKRDDVIAWMNEQTNDHKWDVSSLPAEIQPIATEFIKFNESFTDEMRAVGQHVMDPRTGRSRLPEKLPGYFPYAFNKDVFDDLAQGGDRADYWQDVWIKHYMRETGDSSPSGRAKAIEALRLQTSPMANITIVGGEPIFLSARRVHGMTIPPEMRDTNLVGAYETYVDRYAQDRVWTLDVQDDPLARRAFGASKDKQFNPVDDSAVEPTATQWDDILAAARKYNSPWISRVKPGMNLGSPVSNESPEALAFIQSFIQRPVQAQTDSARYAATGNAIASAMLMQTASGIRDASAGLSMGAEYVDIQRQIKNSVGVLADYAKARDAALRGGAMQDDVFRHQAAGVLGKASYRAIRALREITGRQILDQYPRVVLYSSAYEQVIDDLSKSGESPLANEFSTASTREKGSNDEIAAETAANIVERVAPSYDARNLPPGLVPQTANWLGHMIGLARWGVARYNNWFEDTLRPALRQGDLSRLIKTLFVGLLGAAATNTLIEELRRKKPAGLTWQEWLKLDTDAQIKHAAPLFMSLYQMNGTFGAAGDMMLPVLRAATGAEPLRVESVEPAMPLVIVGKQLFDKTTSFMTYAGQKDWKLDGEDLADLSVEMMSSMQLFRDLRDWSLTKEQRAEKEMVREERLYERLNARSARTDQPLEQPMFESPIRGQAFSLSKEFNSRDMVGLRSLAPTLVERAERGEPLPNVTQNKYEDKFWLDVARRRGVEKTRELYGVNAAEQEEDSVRKELLKELKRIRKRALQEQEDE